jgi:4-aminobutyrate aminotransferase-like enzyme
MRAVDFADAQECSRVYDALIESGCRAGNRGTALRIDPPLIVAEEELAGFAAALKAPSARAAGNQAAAASGRPACSPAASRTIHTE